MQRLVAALAVAVAAGAAALASWPQHAPPGARPARHQPHAEDDLSMDPGIHRAGPAELAVRDRVARAESVRAEQRARAARARRGAKAASVPSTSWVNLGPTDAPVEINYYQIAGVDSGRPTAIAVDPRDPNVVYVAVSGGGVWKTYDFLAQDGPTWAPTMDTQPNLAVGALALDPDHPDTVFVGTGDFRDASGDTVVRSDDGAGTWGVPVVLGGTYPAPNGAPAKVGAIRQLQVRGALVLAATDVGLFASHDGGQSFALVDLPNTGGATLAESVWNVVPIGGGGWVAAGVTACAPGQPAPGLAGLDVDPTNCPAGNIAAIWRTTDGVTWSAVAPLPLASGTGRIAIAAGSTSDPTKTVVYAFVGAVDGSKTLGFWRSDDAGATWVDATGALANPTTSGQQGDECTDTNVGHDQSWYNQAIVVDPTNAAHVLVGGNLCGMRTLNGTATAPTWESVSHWLPGPGYGETAHGRLPYVHADWHTALSVPTPQGGVRTFAGTDGGVFSSTNVFDDKTPAEQVTWANHNRGLATHLIYALASGDPTTQNPFVLFGGLQDNGTRFRTDPSQPSAFNQPVGGDGIGAAVHVSSSGTTYWASTEYHRAYCKPAEVDCSVEVPETTDPKILHWNEPPSPWPLLEPDELSERRRERDARSGEQTEPFLMHYANVETDTTGQSVLTHNDSQVGVLGPDGAGGFAITQLSQDLSGDPSGAGINNVAASRTTPGLYGAVGAVSRYPFYVTTAGNTPTTWTVAAPVKPDGQNRLTGPSSIDFPPTLPAGKAPGDVFLGAFDGTMNDPARTPPPDDQGHLYRTTDGGKTWTTMVGSDPTRRLPNVPVHVVKYDPVVATTIYAGTDLGVYFTTDDGAHWDRMGDNFPLVPVRDLYVAKNQEFIRVATYGRGFWEIYPSATANPGALGNGDYDRNLRLDWVDLAAMSSRLGDTPATTTAPFYSWILDMAQVGTPPAAAIDDDDLNALLAKLGGHP